MSATTDRFWLKSYPAGVPAEIDYTQYNSLAQLLDEACKKYAARQAFVGLGQSMTYAQVDSESKCVAAWLQSKGLQKGDRVAIMMPNVLQYPVVLAGILRAGMVVVNVNPLYTPRELEHQLKDSGAKAIFILENFAVTLQQVVRNTDIKHTIVCAMGDMLNFAKGAIINFVVRHVKKMVPEFALPNASRFNALLAESVKLPFNPPSITREDVAFLQYTGGTTGLSKGATLTHRNIIANVLQSEAWMQPALNKPPST